MGTLVLRAPEWDDGELGSDVRAGPPGLGMAMGPLELGPPGTGVTGAGGQRGWVRQSREGHQIWGLGTPERGHWG